MGTSHLSDEQIEELMVRYYAGDDVAELIKEFRLCITPGRIYTLFPPIVREDLNCCPYCIIHLIQKRVSKSAVRTGYEIPSPHCTSCGHKASSSCKCSNCLAEKERLVKLQESELQERLSSIAYDQREDQVSTEQLSLKEAIDLVSLSRAGREEDSDKIKSIVEFDLPAGPTLEYTIESIKHLYKRKLINIAPGNPLECFSFKNRKVEPVEFKNIHWKFRLGKNQAESIESIYDLDACLHDMDKWPADWKHELYNVWMILALHENLKYLEVILVDHNFIPRIGDKTKRTLISLLHSFSISQSYTFIWSSVRSAAAYFQRGNISRQRAANTIIGKCQITAERALCEDWDVKKYRRDYRCIESISSSLFANVVAGIGEDFFNKKPFDFFDTL